MKFPYSMLLDFVETDMSAEEAGDLLTMAGFELEGIEEIQGEAVLDVKVMSNRGDGLSVYGLAREVLAKRKDAKPTALYQAAEGRFRNSESKGESSSDVAVKIETKDCRRYSCRLFSGLGAKASPTRIQDRLTKAGMRPISLLVDLTNYVMLEMGQPLHAFDFDTLRGGTVIVRKARPGEKLVTLDGEERLLDPEMMVIADSERAVALAGVMGGAETEVSNKTTNVLLESASFLNTSVRRTRRRLGMSSEASYRFERSVDPEGTVAAIVRFSALLADALGEQVQQSEVVDAYPHSVAPRRVEVRLDRAEKLLGLTIGDVQLRRYLTMLGFKLSEPQSGSAYLVEIPSWRPDIVREEDLVEEIGRVHGFDRIPEKLPVGSTTLGGTTGYPAWKDLIRNMVLRLGYSQIISHTLREASPLDDPRIPKAGPRGVLDPEMMWLRNSTLASLVDASRRNGGKDLHLFEIGQVFGRHQAGFDEHTCLGILCQGAQHRAWWGSKIGEESSFYSLKGELAELGQTAGLTLDFRAPAELDARLHPTRQAELCSGSIVLGRMGQVDPDTAEQTGIPGDTLLAEINLQLAYGCAAEVGKVRPISRNPAVRRDIAFLISKAIAFSRIEDAVIKAGGSLLEKHWLFDVYEGKSTGEGEHSLAIALQLRKLGANLTDDEANQARAKVAEALVGLGATLR